MLGKILNSSLTQKLITFARAMIPVLRWIVSRHDSILADTLLSSIQRMPADSDMIEARAGMNKIGTQLLEDSHAGILTGNSTTDKSRSSGDDLLSLLMKANIATDLRPELRMTDEEVVSRACSWFLAFEKHS